MQKAVDGMVDQVRLAGSRWAIEFTGLSVLLNMYTSMCTPYWRIVFLVKGCTHIII